MYKRKRLELAREASEENLGLFLIGDHVICSNLNSVMEML